ncbi:MAG: SIMPL domain-containing protein [bacterium]
MPTIKKVNKKIVSKAKIQELVKVPVTTGRLTCCNSIFGRKIIMTLFGVLLAYLIFFLGTLINNNIKKAEYIGKPEKMERTITVVGYGRATGNKSATAVSVDYASVYKEILKDQARIDALADAKKKADIVAKSLGVNLVGVNSYAEYEVNKYPEYNYIQGSIEGIENVNVYSDSVEMNANVVYEIK